MIELFGDTPREIYGKAPVIEVICQLRFPTLLRIENQQPVEFQEQIRNIFPLMDRPKPPAFPADVPPEVAQIILAQAGQSSSTKFLTENKAYAVTLSPSSLALSTTMYARWEHFREHLEPALQALADVYKPSFFPELD